MRLVGYYACFAMFLVAHFLPELMQASGVRGTVIAAAVFLPVAICAVLRGSYRTLFRGSALPLSLLVVWALASGWHSEHGTDVLVCRTIYDTVRILSRGVRRFRYRRSRVSRASRTYDPQPS